MRDKTAPTMEFSIITRRCRSFRHLLRSREFDPGRNHPSEKSRPRRNAVTLWINLGEKNGFSIYDDHLDFEYGYVSRVGRDFVGFIVASGHERTGPPLEFCAIITYASVADFALSE